MVMNQVIGVLRSSRGLAVALSLSLIVLACGGGGSGGSASAPTGSSGVSVGPITGFGSVFVNGTRFNTDNAVVTRNGATVGDVTELAIGMVVRVSGDLERNIADSVSFEADVKGPIDTISGDTLAVMGQMVTTSAATVFNNANLADLNVGDVVEVSGMRGADQVIAATFVERKAAADVNRFEVIGLVSDLDTAAMTFRIVDLVVDYSQANVNDLPGGVPQDGQLVEVQDDAKSYVAGSMAVSASKVEPRSPLTGGTGGGSACNGDSNSDGNSSSDDDSSNDGSSSDDDDSSSDDDSGSNPDSDTDSDSSSQDDNGDCSSSSGMRVEIESVITDVNSPEEFVINGITVSISADTVFVFGVADGIIVGARVEVEGQLDSGGVLQASRIKFEDNDVRIEASVDAVDNGTVTLLGIDVQVDDSSGIQAGDFLEIRGFVGADGAIVSTEVRREGNDGTVRLRGPASSVDSAARTVTILGIDVNTDGGTRFEDLGDTSTAAEDFFAAITPNLTIVQAQWRQFSDVTAPASELELED